VSKERVQEVLALLRIFIAITTAAIISLIGWMYVHEYALIPLLALATLALFDMLLISYYIVILNYYDI